jgi:hypothetical protein
MKPTFTGPTRSLNTLSKTHATVAEIAEHPRASPVERKRDCPVTTAILERGVVESVSPGGVFAAEIVVIPSHELPHGADGIPQPGYLHDFFLLKGAGKTPGGSRD